jgi:hypothetical protein
MNADQRLRLTKMVLRLFVLWGIYSREVQGMLLGLPQEELSTICDLNHGRPLPDRQDVMERVGHLLAIHKLLRTLFPQQRSLAYAWMTTPNAAFAESLPITLVRGGGTYGLVCLRNYLELQTQV